MILSKNNLKKIIDRQGRCQRVIEDFTAGRLETGESTCGHNYGHGHGHGGCHGGSRGCRE